MARASGHKPLSLRFRLLVPVVLLSLMLGGVIVLLFVSNRTAQRAQAQQRTQQRQFAARSYFLTRLQEIRSYVGLVNRNQLVGDGLQFEDQSKVLDVLLPF